MTPVAAGVLALAAVFTLGACGTTYIDSDVTIPPTVDTTTTTFAPVADDAPLADLLSELESLMRHLDEQIVDDDGQAATLVRIEALWVVAERQIRERDPDDVFPFEQAVGLARSGVERLRPADASKGYKVLVAAIASYDA